MDVLFFLDYAIILDYLRKKLVTEIKSKYMIIIEMLFFVYLCLMIAILGLNIEKINIIIGPMFVGSTLILSAAEYREKIKKGNDL
ncbi:hypothetical protein AZF37_08645 [endosymbiont 'TC1' of Trimyema compressum]|nr:hypothetical protein AZF37_08645 [endosymbiont 'TC1' of Trimyema compressum]